MPNILDITYDEFELAVDSLVAVMKLIHVNDDVHKHSIGLGQACTKFLTLDDKYQISNTADLTFEQVYEQIKAYAQSQNELMVLKVLDTIRDSSGVETETGLNVQDLLIRTWGLVSHKFAPENIMGLIIDNLKHNVEAGGGGCLAGISARLTQPYCSCIRSILETALERKAIEASCKEKEDRQLQLQQAASIQYQYELQLQQPPAVEVEASHNNKEDESHGDDVKLELAATLRLTSI